MNAAYAAVLAGAPVFALALARIGGVMAFLPGLGEATAPATARIALAAAVTLLLLPGLPALPQDAADGGLRLGLMAAGEAATGMWFGWIVRVIVLALPAGAQFIAYLIGMSSVLQPDAELGAQSSVIGTLFNMAAPAIVLSTGLYRLPLGALDGFFRLIPPGHLLPLADGAGMTVKAVASAFNLALQVASPFVVAAIVWQFAIGLLARTAARMQIYFVSMPGQILTGFVLLIFALEAVVAAWRDGTVDFLGRFTGALGGDT